MRRFPRGENGRQEVEAKEIMTLSTSYCPSQFLHQISAEDISITITRRRILTEIRDTRWTRTRKVSFLFSFPWKSCLSYYGQLWKIRNRIKQCSIIGVDNQLVDRKQVAKLYAWSRTCSSRKNGNENLFVKRQQVLHHVRSCLVTSYLTCWMKMTLQPTGIVSPSLKACYKGLFQ